MDFGISSPTAVVECCFDGDNTFYLKEILYKPSKEMGMSIGEYLQKPRNGDKPLVDRDKITVCDSAKESMVIDLAKTGLTAVSALKGRGSKSRTISTVQSFRIVYTTSSKNLSEEYFNFSFKLDRYGLVDEEPEPNKADHLMDASGYIITYLVNYFGIGNA